MTLTTREKILFATSCVALVTCLVSAYIILTLTVRIPSVGRIKAIGVEVFWDSNATQTVEYVDWGTIAPGDLVGVTLYFRNTKNTNFTMILNSSAWEPINASQYLTLDWNYTGQIIQPEQTVPVQLTLYASLQIKDITVFSFDININADEC